MTSPSSTSTSSSFSLDEPRLNTLIKDEERNKSVNNLMFSLFIELTFKTVISGKPITPATNNIDKVVLASVNIQTV